MSYNKAVLAQAIIRQGLLPLFYHEDEQVSLNITRTLYRAGIRSLEYTNRGGAALRNFKTLKQLQQDELPGLHLGIGTIKTIREAESFLAAGAEFIVSPVFDPEVATLSVQEDLLWIPGCMTPTEIYTAQCHEAAIIKLFPAGLLGPELLNSIKELFSGLNIIPTGGVDASLVSISAWFKAGVCAVGMGSKLISPEIMNSGLYEKLHGDIRRVLELVQSARAAIQ